MIPKVHKKGRSFRGAANYLLHDKDRATTNERVAWTSTRNLATRDPHAAWRVMAATAMDQNRLKAQAGVKNTGRKSSDSVLHLTLSWHPDESEGLSRDEMMKAAFGAIRALGAEDRQALFVSHNDEPQPHIHILINRVSPADGRMLSSSKEKLRLSEWAQAYEAERGKILCEQRVINNAARDRGEYTRAEPDKPRHIHELEAANDNTPDIEAIKTKQKELDLALGRKTRDMKARHAQEFRELADRFKQERAETRAAAKIEALRARDAVRAKFRPEWEARHHEHQAELRAFEQREKQLLGRVSNALRAIDFGSMVSGKYRRQAVLDAYNAVSSSGGRLEGFRRSQAVKDRELERRQIAEEQRAASAARSSGARRLAEQRALFKAERASLVLKHDLERAASRTQWRSRSEDRRTAFEKNRFHGNARGPERHQEPDGKQTIERDRVADEMAKIFKRMRERRERGLDRGDEHER
jgi:hypothetical protein